MEKLIDYFKPSHYTISLFIDKHQGSAKGHVSIEGEPKQGKIKLHAKDLTIDRVSFRDLKDAPDRPGKIVEFTTTKDGILEIPYFPGREAVIVDIDYHFDLNTNMQGAYLSTYRYTDENGEDREEILVSTQFESHYARECFPCVDEPAAKATFSLDIEIPDPADTVISNGDLSQTVVGKNGHPRYFFEKTPRMSTYLLAFCIGKFQKTTAKTSDGVVIDTYCTMNHPESSTKFATETAKQCIEYYNHLFDTKYPLTHLTQIAIPDFEAGAMENWGLVTYRESCLLVDKNTTLSSRQYVATVIAHELSHQWFGNLVTMKWWDDLWLNESFANIMEYIAVDALHPEYNIWRDYYTTQCFVALSRDALPGVQAVKQDVDDPAEISALFDGAIVYAKGSRLILMLIRQMGQKAFFAGIKDYLKKHAYNNTTGDDLWAALQPHAKFNVKEFMDAWISQPGYPVLTDGVEQRFLLTGDTDDTTWPIPEIKDDMSGHYLINLSGDEFDDALKDFNKLGLEQKIRLLMDRFFLSKTSLVSSANLLDLLPKFRGEQSFAIWDMLSKVISGLKVFFPYDDPDRPLFQKYVADLIEPQLTRLGITPRPTDTDNETKLREIILGLAYFADHDPTLNALSDLYQPDLTRLDPEIRVDILLAKLKTSKEAVFKDYLETYKKTADPDIKEDLLFTFTDAEKHTKELIELLEAPKIVKPQDHGYLFGFLVRNYFTKREAKEWLLGHWSYVENLLGEKSVDVYPRYFAGSVRTAEEATEFSNFFRPLAERNGSITRAVELSEREIDARLKLLSMDDKDVHNRLKKIH